jgi:soluble lytic murein transglycosylase-like protein
MSYAIASGLLRLPLLPVLLAVTGFCAAAAPEDKAGSFSDGTGVRTYRVYTYRQPDGVSVFTDKVPPEQRYEVMEFACYACDPHSRIDWSSTRLFTAEYSGAIEDAARENGVDPALVRAVIHAESGFNPRARSRKGAMGLMQLMPGTASDMGVRDPWAVQQNIEGGVKYLAMLLAEFKGDVTLATAAYNAGPGAVDRYGGVPPIAETQAYVQRVKQLLGRYRDAG